MLTSVLAAGFAYPTAPQQVVYGLDSDVSGDLSLDDFMLDNLSTNSTIARSTESLSYIGPNGWSIQFPGQSGSGVTGMQQSRPHASASAAAENEHR